MAATATMPMTEQPRPQRGPGRPSFSTVAAMLLSVALPTCGWMVSISNRVAALEVRTQSLATSAQMAEVKQRIDDWIQAADRSRAERERTEDRIEAMRKSR